MLQQFAKQLVHFDRSENIKYNGNNGKLGRRIILPLWSQAQSKKRTYLKQIQITFSYHYDNDVQYVPDAFEIGELVNTQLKNFLHNIIEDE